MFSLIYARINGWVNTGEAGDLWRHHARYDVIVMFTWLGSYNPENTSLSWLTIMHLVYMSKRCLYYMHTH